MSNREVKCAVCSETIKGIGYEMPSKWEEHMRIKHPEDWNKIVELNQELKLIKDKYNLYLYGTY